VPVRELIGNLFNAQTQTIVNTVNTRGVMGKGIALEFKRRFPAMFEDYRRRCDEGRVHVGETYLYKGSTPWVLNFPTKDHWRFPSQLPWIEQGLAHFAKHYQKWGVTSIAFPQLGTQNGGLAWSDVRRVMLDALSPLELDVAIYTFGPDQDDERSVSWLNHAREQELVSRLAIKPSLAQAILVHRSSIGSFHRLEQLHDISGVGTKTYARIVGVLNYTGISDQLPLL